MLNKNVLSSLKEWLKENNVPNYIGIHPSVAANFNKFVRKTCPELFKQAQEIAKRTWRHSVCYDEDLTYYWINYPSDTGLRCDPFIIRPSQTLVIAETMLLIAVKISEEK